MNLLDYDVSRPFSAMSVSSERITDLNSDAEVRHLVFELREAAKVMHSVLLVESRNGLGARDLAAAGRHGTEADAAAACSAKSRISNRSRRASHGTPSSNRRSRSAAVSAARCASIVASSTPGAVIRPVPGEWHPRVPEQLGEEELADWRAGRNAVHQLAALTIGARLAVADAYGFLCPLQIRRPREGAVIFNNRNCS